MFEHSNFCVKRHSNMTRFAALFLWLFLCCDGYMVVVRQSGPLGLKLSKKVHPRPAPLLLVFTR
jgi:hypothetical protein